MSRVGLRRAASSASVPARWFALLAGLLAAVVIAGCAPAARSELPREVRGTEVHAKRLKSGAAADELLRKVAVGSPLQASLDGCLDLRANHSGYLWRCSVVRAATVVGEDPAATLEAQHTRLRDLGCAAYPGLITSANRLKQGLQPRFLYDVEYHCPDQSLVLIRFSDPEDPDLASKVDLTNLQSGPGRGNVISDQPVSPAALDQLRTDTSTKLVMVVAVARTYWMMPAS